MKTPRLTRRRGLALALCTAAVSMVTTTTNAALPAAGAAAGVPRLDHVVIVMMENKNYTDIIGRPDEAPYLNDLSSRSATFDNSFAVTHPSQPNYIALFSGSTQGVTSDDCPQTFNDTPNLGTDLINAGDGFAGYSEDLDHEGDTECGDHWYWPFGYARKHVPWVDFTNVPSTSNKTWDQFPSDYSQLPTVSFVIPDMCDDMHSCSRDQGDEWIQDNLGAYATWAESHNSMLIVTFDEDDDGDNRIPTIFHGAHVRPGMYGEWIDHYSVLRTIEDMYSLPQRGGSAARSPITDIWN